jgi:hypothetical protein
MPALCKKGAYTSQMQDVGGHIVPEEFPEFLEMMSLDPTFPRTLAEWQATEAIPVKHRVTIHPEEFSAYCIAIKQPTCLVTFNAFALYKLRL